MPRSREQLNAGEWAVLGLIDEQPTYGFAVARAMAPSGEIGRVWSLRRPLVYRALDSLLERGLACSAGTASSEAGPQRKLIEATPAGSRTLAAWLREPVEHVRDARSLLMLKLVLLSRRGTDPEPLLADQRARFAVLHDRLSAQADAADGFDRALCVWRLENAGAVLRFIDTLLEDHATRV